MNRVCRPCGFSRAVVAIALAVATVAAAGPRKILVLPLDGDAEASRRAKIGNAIVKAARSLEGKVTTGNTTFSETAAAVGCDPSAPACAEEVLSTLSVDEVVWGSATTVNGQTIVVVRRAAKGSSPREMSVTVAAGESGAKLEAAVAPVFQPPGAAPPPPTPPPTPPPPTPSPPAVVEPPAHATTRTATAEPPHNGGETEAGSGSGSGSGSATEAAPPPQPEPSPGPPVDEHDRNLGLGLAIGGGLAFLVGLALWASEDSLQRDIENHQTRTFQDIQDLKALEDRAGNYALGGNVMVIAGLATAGVGAYYLYKWHQHRTVIAPVPVEHGNGAALVLEGRW